MTLVSTYDPSSQAPCPKCGQCHCDNIGGITFGIDPYLDFEHRECGTTWRWHIYTGEVEAPIPVPMTLRQMMGEENWARQQEKECAQHAAIDMLAALEAMLAGDVGSVEMATAAVAKARGKRE